jgi:hypothetical protein
MREIEVNGKALVFCRTITALLLLYALVFTLEGMVIAVFLLMVIPAIFSVRAAPFFALYNSVIGNKLGFARRRIAVPAVRFAHGFGATLLGSAILSLYTGHAITAWILVASVMASTSFGAAGFCVGEKIFYAFRSLFRLGDGKPAP